MPDELLTADDLAAVFRVEPNAIHKWTKQGMPSAERGKGGRGNRSRFKLQPCVEWYFQTNFERLELDRQRTRLASEQANKQAMENAVRAGELAEIGEIERAFTAAAMKMRALLLALPSGEAPMLAAMTDPNAVESRLRDAIYRALSEIAAWGGNKG